MLSRPLLSISAAAILMLALSVGYYKLRIGYLEEKITTIQTQARHDVAEAHIEEIDFSLASQLKNIQETHDDNITLSPAATDGTWRDDFGM